MKNTLPLAGLLLLSLTACNRGAEPASTTEAQAPAAVASTDADVATQSPVDPRSDSPARLDGFGPVTLGSSVEDVRAGWGEPLKGEVPDEFCHYLRPQDEPPAGPWLMIEGHKLVRYDVRGTGIVAPGGGKVGMVLAELQALYPDRADLGPDKYDETVKHLRVMPAVEGQAVIDFTVDAEGKVSAWRVGLVPQVDYVEGCG